MDMSRYPDDAPFNTSFMQGNPLIWDRPGKNDVSMFYRRQLSEPDPIEKPDTSPWVVRKSEKESYKDRAKQPDSVTIGYNQMLVYACLVLLACCFAIIMQLMWVRHELYDIKKMLEGKRLVKPSE